MSKTHKLLWAVALLAVLALAGCESDPGPPAEPEQPTPTEVEQPTIEPTTPPATQDYVLVISSGEQPVSYQLELVIE